MTQTLTPTDRAQAILPTALALALAVNEYDEQQVRTLLTDLDREQMRALAIVLAAHVDLDKPMSTLHPTAPTEAQTIDRAANLAAAMFNLPPALVLSRDQHRAPSDARAVAMYALRLMGLSSPVIGAAFDRDHTTVLHACGRVGETLRLRRLGLRVAEQLGWDRNAAEDVA